MDKINSENWDNIAQKSLDEQLDFVAGLLRYEKGVDYEEIFKAVENANKIMLITKKGFKDCIEFALSRKLSNIDASEIAKARRESKLAIAKIIRYSSYVGFGSNRKKKGAGLIKVNEETEIVADSSDMDMKDVLKTAESPKTQNQFTTSVIQEILAENLSEYEKVGPLTPDGLRLVVKDSKCGYVDKENKLIVPCIYDNGRDFCNSFAAVSNENDLWGFVGKDGNALTICKYDDVYDYSEGLAAVKFGGKHPYWIFIDEDGKMAFNKKFEEAESFENGKAEVIEMNSRERITINKKGNRIN